MFLISEEQLKDLLWDGYQAGKHHDANAIDEIIEDFKNNNNKQNVPENKERTTSIIPNKP